MPKSNQFSPSAGLLDDVGDFFEDGWETVKDGVTKGWDYVSDGAKDAMGWVEDQLTELGEQIYDAVVTPIIEFIQKIFYKMLVGILQLVGVFEDAFSVFAGTEKIEFDGMHDYLINIFFANNTVTTAFWGVCAIAVVLTFVFTIIAVTRKTIDIEGNVRESVGEIITKALKTALTLLLLSAICIASIKLASTTFLTVDSMMARSMFAEDIKTTEKTFTDEEYTIMSDIYETVCRYDNAAAENLFISLPTYNVNACYNEIRRDLLRLQQFGFYNYDYTPEYKKKLDISNNPHINIPNQTWQYAIFLIGTSGVDLDRDIGLRTENAALYNAMINAFYQSRNGGFRPQKTVTRKGINEVHVDDLLFITATLNTTQDEGDLYEISYNDPKRIGYFTGEKDYTDYSQVKADFSMSFDDFDYFTPALIAIVFLIVFGICIVTFVARLFELVFLYIISPVFCSVSPLDGGEKFNSWRQAFIVKLVAGFGGVYIMRIYMMLVPIVISDKMVIFENSFSDWLAKMLFLLGGAFAVLKGNTMLSNIVANNPGAANMTEAAMAGFATAKVGQQLHKGSEMLKSGTKEGTKLAAKGTWKGTKLAAKGTWKGTKLAGRGAKYLGSKAYHKVHNAFGGKKSDESPADSSESSTAEHSVPPRASKESSLPPKPDRPAPKPPHPESAADVPAKKSQPAALDDEPTQPK